jgi:hypothetical protein
MINLNWSKKDLYFCLKETGIYMAIDPIILWIKLFYNVSIRGDGSMFQEMTEKKKKHMQKQIVCNA